MTRVYDRSFHGYGDALTDALVAQVNAYNQEYLNATSQGVSPEEASAGAAAAGKMAASQVLTSASNVAQPTSGATDFLSKLGGSAAPGIATSALTSLAGGAVPGKPVATAGGAPGTGLMSKSMLPKVILGLGAAALLGVVLLKK